MSTDQEDINPYELLGVTLQSTEAEIRTAYRQRSLKVHPDRNRGNPDAARKFHELNQAYELLLDPLRRMALDAKMRIKEARKTRFASYDAKRKGLVEELEERERALKKARVEKETESKERMRANERIMEEGRKLREDREKELRKKELERLEAERKINEAGLGDVEPPTLGALDTTVRLKYSLASHPSLTTTAALIVLLTPFGTLDESSIVLSLKPAPPKQPKRGIALVPFHQIGGAFAAVCSSGHAENGLGGIEVTWAEGREPGLIGWLKQMGKLGGPTKVEMHTSSSANRGAEYSTPVSAGSRKRPVQTANAPSDVNPPPSGAFSSFPSSFPDLGVHLQTPESKIDVPGLDYESLTLMRLREAERARLEREIREREAADVE